MKSAASGNRKDFAIALAWPSTLCKEAGAWYDLPLRWLRINKDRYYRVGHAAVVLIDSQKGECRYFDFGRYHAPAGFGRVRDAETDHDLQVYARPKFDGDGALLNQGEILLELFQNVSCHGSGTLFASICQINFENAFSAAKEMQEQSPIPYGPFIPSGTNCSRFVNSVIRAGRPGVINEFFLRFPKTLSPTPIGNVRVFNNIISVSEKSLPIVESATIYTAQEGIAL